MLIKKPFLMERRGFVFLFFSVTFLSLVGSSTSSNRCILDAECTNTSSSGLLCCRGNICLLGNQCQVNDSSKTNSSSLQQDNFLKNSSNSGNWENMLNNNTFDLHYGLCTTDDHCNSTKRICISLKCSTKNSDQIEDCERCESVGCEDGRCFNNTRLLASTGPPGKEGTITTLQLVLLFGSMGGIFIFIIIVYCVKTFTDNRRRQYLLKHGVWDTPPKKEGNSKDKGEDGESRSESSRQQRKLEVPTITVETETDSKKKRKKKENSKEESTDTEGLEEFAVQQECKRPKVIMPIADEEPLIIQPSPVKKNLSQIGQTMASPMNTSIPIDWDNASEITPLTTDSPKQKRFGNFNIRSKENSPTKVIANGNPENSPIFGRPKKNSPPVKLCEPENFSDYGM